MIGESDARLLEVRMHAEHESVHYEEQGRVMEMDVHRIHRVLQAADKNATESQNSAPVVTTALASAHAQTV